MYIRDLPSCWVNVRPAQHEPCRPTSSVSSSLPVTVTARASTRTLTRTLLRIRPSLRWERYEIRVIPPAGAHRPLFQFQELQLGEYVRSLYLDPSSSSYVGLTTPLFNQSQFWARADAADEGFVILDSANALVQGLFPATVGFRM